MWRRRPPCCPRWWWSGRTGTGWTCRVCWSSPAASCAAPPCSAPSPGWRPWPGWRGWTCPPRRTPGSRTPRTGSSSLGSAVWCVWSLGSSHWRHWPHCRRPCPRRRGCHWRSCSGRASSPSWGSWRGAPRRGARAPPCPRCRCGGGRSPGPRPLPRPPATLRWSCSYCLQRGNRSRVWNNRN